MKIEEENVLNLSEAIAEVAKGTTVWCNNGTVLGLDPKSGNCVQLYSHTIYPDGRIIGVPENSLPMDGWHIAKDGIIVNDRKMTGLANSIMIAGIANEVIIEYNGSVRFEPIGDMAFLDKLCNNVGLGLVSFLFKAGMAHLMVKEVHGDECNRGFSIS